jgi:hypothetical protein
VSTHLFLDAEKKYGHTRGMAMTTVKSTYSLDLDSVQALDEIAQRWKVSKSEALRRAIRTTRVSMAEEEGGAIEALDRLQEIMRVTPRAAREWARRSRQERRAGSSRREVGRR